MVIQCKNLISLYILLDQRRGNLLVNLYNCEKNFVFGDVCSILLPIMPSDIFGSLLLLIVVQTEVF